MLLKYTNKIKKYKEKKMKKALVIILSLLFALSCVLLVACNETVTSLEIEGAPEQVVRGSTIDYSTVYVVATFEDGTTSDPIPLTDRRVSFNQIDTSTTGSKTLTVTYGGKSTSKVITVIAGAVDVDTVIVTEYNNTDGYNEYLDSIKAQSNPELEFYNRDVLYTVGTTNGYRFLPVVTALDESGEELPLDKVETTFKLFRKEGASEVEITGSNLDIYLSSVEDNVYYFTPAAEHETFRLEVTLSDRYVVIDEEMSRTVEQTFRVVSGYNAYDVLGLSVLDNCNVKAWSSIKEHKFPWDNGKKVSEFTDVEQVILHNNVTIKAEDLPAIYFWKEGEHAAKEGSVGYDDAKSRSPEGLRDYLTGSLKEIYLGEDWEHGDNHQRGLFVTSGIGLSGNFLKIDYEANVNKNGQRGLYIVHDFNQTDKDNLRTYPETHYSLISFRKEGIKATDNGNFTVENVYFVGQTSKTEHDDIPAGLMMIASNVDELKVNNVIGAKWFCNLTLDGVDNAHLNISNSKMYDSFSQMVFSRRSVEINVTNSEMKRAGGPIMIIHTRTGSGDSSVTNTVVNVDSTANMESWLTGNEMWFTINNLPASDIVPMFGVASMSDSAVNTHYNVDNKVNLIAVVIPNPGDVFDNQKTIKGTINVGEAVYSMDDAVFNSLLAVSEIASAGAQAAANTITVLDQAHQGGQLPDEQYNQYKPMMEALQAGFAGLAGLPIAPAYKSGSNYGYFDGSSFNTLSVMQQLYGGAQLAKETLIGFNQTEVAAQWDAVLNNQYLITIASASPSTGDWTDGHLACWINPGADLENPAKSDFNVKHFMILLGESQAA